MMQTLALALTLTYVASELATRGAVMRFVWREIIRLFIVFDLAMMRLVQRVLKPRFEVRGSCDKRGVCCTQIVGNPPRFVRHSPRLINLFAAFHQVMHNFHVVARGPDGELIFRCGYLKTDGRCGIYRYRPLICRNYPVLPFFEPPRLLPGCGYKVVPRVVGRLRGRASLRIINPMVAVHHPTPPRRPPGADEEPGDYHWVDAS